jgi:transcriptional regulator with XRE-family HTH domain
VTFPIVVDLERRQAAGNFAALLATTMKARRIGRKPLAAAMGLQSHSIIAQWRTGNTLPSLESALRLGAALEEPRLAELVRRARTHHCERAGCTTKYLYEGGGPSRFCSPQCGKMEAKARALGPPAKVRATEAESGLALSRQAVAAMCRSCEPEGYCHQVRCDLRVVSPLPVVTDPRPAPELAEPMPGPYGSPENRAKTIGALRERLALRWADPEEHRIQSERSTAMHAERRQAADDLRSRLEEVATTIVQAAERG